MPVCSVCGAERSKEQYSATQLTKKGGRKCKDCVASRSSGNYSAAGEKYKVANAGLIYETSGLLAKELGVVDRWAQGNTAEVGDNGQIIARTTYSANQRACVALQMAQDGRIVLIEDKGIAKAAVSIGCGQNQATTTPTGDDTSAATASQDSPKFAPGTAVELHNLQGAPQHNGKVGTITAFDPQKGRWVVKLAQNEQLSLKAANLRLSHEKSAAMAMKPAKIGAGNGAGTGSSASIQNTPYGRYFAKLDKIMDKVPNSVGRIFIRGVLGEDNGDDDGEAHDDELDENKATQYSDSQMVHMRWVIVTKSRAYWLTNMKALLLGSQAEAVELGMPDCRDFFAQVLEAGKEFLAELEKVTKPNQQLDLLFAFTYNLDLYDSWIANEEIRNVRESTIFLSQLAAEWKTCLLNDDAILGIDSEFTRPALLCMLEQFKNKYFDGFARNLDLKLSGGLPTL